MEFYRYMRYTILTLILVGFMTIYASEASIIVTDGLSREFTVKIEEVVESEITIRNTGSEPAEIKIYLRDYFYTWKGITSYKKSDSLDRSNASWIKLKPEKRVTVPGDGETTVSYRIEVPDNSDLKGTYWSMLMLEPEKGIEIINELDKQKMQAGIHHITRYGVQIRTHIGNTGLRDLKIIDRSLVRNEEGNLYLKLALKNTGERWLDLKTRVELYNEDGYLETEIKGPAARLYPATSVQRHIELKDVDPGHYQALVILDGGADELWGAHYQIKVN